MLLSLGGPLVLTAASFLLLGLVQLELPGRLHFYRISAAHNSCNKDLAQIELPLYTDHAF